MFRALICLLSVALAAAGAEVTGKWSGSFDMKNPDGSTRPSTAYLDLKQSGAEVSGTAGPNTEQRHPIQKGKLAGKKLTFEVQSGDEGVMRFDLVFENDGIEGDVTHEVDGKPSGRTARLAVTRAK